MGVRMKLSPIPLPLRVNRSFIVLVKADFGEATSLSRYAAESVNAAPNPSIGW